MRLIICQRKEKILNSRRYNICHDHPNSVYRVFDEDTNKFHNWDFESQVQAEAYIAELEASAHSEDEKLFVREDLRFQCTMCKETDEINWRVLSDEGVYSEIEVRCRNCGNHKVVSFKREGNTFVPKKGSVREPGSKSNWRKRPPTPNPDPGPAPGTVGQSYEEYLADKESSSGNYALEA